MEQELLCCLGNLRRTAEFEKGVWAGLLEDVPDRHSAKVAPVDCQLATTALKIKSATIPKRWVARQKLSPSLGHLCMWVEAGKLSATLSVNRLGRCRATRPSLASPCE